MKLTLKIELSEETRRQITDQLADFKKLYPQFQWEKIENYNILVDKNLFYLYSFEVALTIGNNIVLYLDFRREKEIERISESIKGLTSTMESSEKYTPRLILAKYKIPSK